MKKETFYGWRVLVGGCIYVLCAMGCAGFHVTLLSIYLDYFHVTLTESAFAFTICNIVAFLSGMMGTSVLKKLSSRVSMIVGCFIMAIFGLLLGYVPSMLGLCLAYGILGIIPGLLSHTVVSNVLIEWFAGQKRTVYVGIAMGCAIFGSGLGSVIAQIFIRAGCTIQQTVLFGPLCLSVTALLATLLLVRNNPQEVGQKPLGIEEGSETELTKESVAEKADRKALFKNPVFILMGVGVLFIYAPAACLSAYLTVYLPIYGIEYSIAASFVTIMGITAGITMLFAGKIINRLGAIPTVVIMFSAAFIGYILLIMVSVKPSVVWLYFVTVCYALAYCVQNIFSVLAPYVFGKTHSTEATSIFTALYYLGGIFLAPAFASIFERNFPLGYGICAGLSLAVMLIFILSLQLAKKRGIIKK